MALTDRTRTDHRAQPSESPPDVLSALRSCAAEGSGQIHLYRRSAKRFVAAPQQLLVRRAFGAGAQLLDAGVRPGQVALVACSAPETALIAFLGALSVGVVPAIVAVRPAFDGPKGVAARIERLQAEIPGVGAVVLQAGMRAALTDRPSCRTIVLTDDGESLLQPASNGPDDLDTTAYIQFTSGTTSRSKPVVITHRALTTNLDAIIERFAVGTDETFLSWLPLYHDMGLVGFPLLALVTGADLALLTPFDFLSDPSRWLAGLSETGATMTASPTFGIDYALRKADPERLTVIDLSRLARLYCAAEPVDADTLRRFHRRFGPYGLRPEALRAGYGMAEAGLMVTMPHFDDEVRVISVDHPSVSKLDRVTICSSRRLLEPRHLDDPETVDLVSLGRPAVGIELWLTRADGTRIHAEDTCGEVTIRGASVTPGYLLPDGGLDALDPTGFRTGDIGLLHDGELYVIERRKNIIIRNGENYPARVLEDALCRVIGIRNDQVLVVDSDIRPGHGEVTALIELDRGQSTSTIKDAIAGGLDAFEPTIDQLVILRPGGLPRTTSGKKQPAEVRARLATDDLKIEERLHLQTDLARGPDHAVIDLVAIEVSETVAGLVADHAKQRSVDTPIHEALRFDADLGFDSLAMFELAIAIESALHIELHERRLASVRTVGELCTITNEARVSPPTNRLGITRSLALSAEAVPQVLNTVTAQRGRQVLIDDRWVTDFASCNYLGLDLHPDVLAAIPPALERWGVHPSWTRAIASPAPYRDLEARLADLVGAADAVVFPTVSLLHIGVLPRLAQHGTIIVDEAAHTSIHQAAQLARAQGVRMVTVRHDDLDDLDEQLAAISGPGPKVIAVDGVYSMSGTYAPLPEIVAIADRHRATVYVDDAHGFGVIGETPSNDRPFGSRGNGVVRYHGLDYDRIVYVGGMSKAYSSMAAFVTVRSPEERHVMEASSTMVFSGPIPVASLASALAGLDVNDREGDALRARLWSRTSQLVDGARDLGFTLDNTTGFPIVNAIVGDIEAVHRCCDILWDQRMLVTPAVFPAVPLHRGGIRFTPTAANTPEEVDAALAALAEARETISPKARPSTSSVKTGE